MGGRRWTKKEDRALLEGAGTFAIRWFQKKAGKTFDHPDAPLRSRAAIYSRARRVFGPGGLRRGTYSLQDLVRETGYARHQIVRARDALDQRWKRLSKRGPFMITLEQFDELVDWLKGDYWCKKLHLYGCVNCGSSEGPSRGGGLCQKCYFQIRRLLGGMGLPTQLSRLTSVLQELDVRTPEMRRSLESIRRNLEKGWAPTIKQIEALKSVLS